MTDDRPHALTVAQLIEKLQAMPPDAPVGHWYDGYLTNDLSRVWLTSGGRVALGGVGDEFYDPADWPEGARQDQHVSFPRWEVP